MMIVDKTPLVAPPPYTPPEHEPSTSSTASTSEQVPDVARCNLLNLDRGTGSISGTYVVDPTLRVPPSLLAALTDEEGERGNLQRPNLRLKCASGKIDADVWVLPSPDPTRVVVASDYGAVNVRLHELGGAHCTSSVAVSSSYGAVKLALPPTFVGTLTIHTTYGSVKLPSSRITTFSEVGGERKCFVGDMSLVGDKGWTGSSVVVDAQYGRVTVSFTDEKPAESGSGSGGSGFFSWFRS